MDEPTSQTAPDALDEPLTKGATAPPRPFRAPRPGMLKRVAIGLFLCAALAFMAVNVLHPGRGRRLANLAATEARLESTMLALEHDNERLMDELRRLERGATGWQQLARKEYGMLLPGEVVYRFPPSRPAAGETSGP